MTCIYNNNPYFHKVTALEQVGGETPTAVNMTVTNDTNIGDLAYFELILTVNPNTVVTGNPLPYTITINGSTVNLVNRYSLPIYTNRLNMRKRYYGNYIVPDSGDPYVILLNTPATTQFARP